MAFTPWLSCEDKRRRCRGHRHAVGLGRSGHGNGQTGFMGAKDWDREGSVFSSSFPRVLHVCEGPPGSPVPETQSTRLGVPQGGRAIDSVETSTRGSQSRP